ncbi:fms-interacting protein domain-containing protein [Ditylenchus destructor]|uniref:Fms-interacting protein domain-containing protein n=1 Tax=Ditylenchus destructor TaxID=166010 RepID=A0AAD4QUH4_9BILA|nr:fms-interacting protein domain-containing protein [Ditylenchus destructor]
MAPDPIIKREPKHHIEKPSVSAFFELEDRLATKLTNEKIKTELGEFTSFIRNQLQKFGNQQEAFKNSQLTDSLMVKAIRLRNLNRLSNFRNKILRERLATARQKAEGHFLQLQNFKSEIGHLRKAIEACLEFQSSDSDIDLVPVEEFFEKAPSSIYDPAVVKDDPHQLQLARLNYELFERKNILGNLQELEGRKSVLLSDIRGKEQRLSQIKPRIEALKTAAKPLLDILGLKNVDPSAFEMYKKLDHLPKELKLAYVLAGVYDELFGENALEIGCEGEIKDAIKLREKSVEKGQAEEESDEEMEEEQKEDEEDTSEKKHKKRKSRHVEREVILDKVQKKKDNLLSAHPISLSIIVPSKGVNSVSVKLTFVLLTQLKCVGLKCKVEGKVDNWQFFDQDNLLDELFHGDAGQKCPNPVGNALLNMLDMNITNYVSLLGKSYKFVQKMCGLTFGLPGKDSNVRTTEPEVSLENSENLQQFEMFAEVIARIQDRMVARQILAERVKELEQYKSIKNLPVVLQQYQPTKQIHSLMISFKPISAEDFAATNELSKWQRQMVDELWRGGQLEAGFQFVSTIKRDKFSANVLVNIPVRYPKHSSILMLVVKSQDHRSSLEYNRALWELESFLNTKVATMLHEDDLDELFSLQMTLLCPKLDAALENVSQSLGSNEFTLA